MNRHGKWLVDFSILPSPSPQKMLDLENRMIREDLRYDVQLLGQQHEKFKM